MTEFLSGLVLGFLLWDWIMLTVAVVVLGGSIYLNTSIGFVISFVGLFFILNNLPVIDSDTLWLIALFYLPVGAFWSFFKYRYYAIKSAEKLKEDGMRVSKDNIRDNLESYVNKDRLIFWVIAFPISMIGHAIFDFLYDLGASIVKRISTVYDRILSSVEKKYEV